MWAGKSQMPELQRKHLRACIQEGKKILLLVYCLFKHVYNADRVTLALRSTHLIYSHELAQ